MTIRTRVCLGRVVVMVKDATKQRQDQQRNRGDRPDGNVNALVRGGFAR